ncbi:aminotransferase class III-fold pyridoxal phosphate-dependent enzyme [Paracoccus suum]|uniref:Aminotransferase class III-fold pyridoxal phosphate-dependent enzyme n=1 Tax=Paracoccus suum TaxID=2259340 RepID=A0A344PLD9_9RHOB|nr:aminotransferase class III-fold pyridoxal phosphate-dependent enzyme [Paracoccus suum]AXC50194.1 aminotransferase class III-fold pyridoxal phosphate-dependent enzyme [Paracoccus suum]
MSMPNAFDPHKATALSEGDRALVARRTAALGAAYRLFYAEPLHPVRGEGVWLWDAEGRRYLDAYNNVACVGHCHPRVVAAMAEQAAVLNTHTRYLHPLVVDYAERVLATVPAPLSNVMFTCTGSEANDLAIRIARTVTGAQGVIVTDYAYHGVTESLAEMSPALGPHVAPGPRVRTVPAPDPTAADPAGQFAEGVRAAIASLAEAGLQPAALLVDTIFASDGILPDPAGTLGPAAEAIRAAGGIFIADEVQAGFGRTGEMWGFSRHGVVPDIVTMGKPMGNGHPVAGLIARADLVESFGRDIRYFNTFGGNPVSAAVGLAVLDVLRDEELPRNSADTGGVLAGRLRDLASRRSELGEVRAAGLYLGVDVRTADGSPDGARASALVNGMRRRGVLISAAGPAGNVLKIRPPLPFGTEHADILVAALEESLTQD